MIYVLPINEHDLFLPMKTEVFCYILRGTITNHYKSRVITGNIRNLWGPIKIKTLFHKNQHLVLLVSNDFW